jgi:hypothetical protein
MFHAALPLVAAATCGSDASAPAVCRVEHVRVCESGWMTRVVSCVPEFWYTSTLSVHIATHVRHVNKSGPKTAQTSLLFLSPPRAVSSVSTH